MPPTVEECGRMRIVAHGDPQNEHRHVQWFHVRPGTVVPGAGVPVAILEHPIVAVVEKVIDLQAWRVIDRIPGYENQMRVYTTIH